MAFFVDLLARIYPGRHEEPSEETPSEQDVFMARNARRLLDGLSRLPGTREDGTVDLPSLREWIQRPRQIAADRDRSEVCDIALAELFVNALQNPKDDWPPPYMAMFIEEIGTDGFFSSFCTAVVNSGGVTVRDPMSGGDQERNLAARYRRLADQVRPVSPRLAETFLQLARGYEAEAKREDDEAERRRLGR